MESRARPSSIGGAIHTMALVSCCGDGRCGSNRDSWLGRLLFPAHESFNQIVEHRNQKDGDKARGEHATDDNKSHHLA